MNAEGTPIPSISFNAKDKRNEESLCNTNAIPSTKQINTANKKLLHDIKWKVINKSYRSLSKLTLEMPIWALIILNGWWINLIIEVAKIHLSDNLVITLAISLLIFSIFFCASFFVNPPKNIFLRMSALIIACLSELLTILGCITIISAHLWLWIPSAAILSAASIFLISKTIKK